LQALRSGGLVIEARLAEAEQYASTTAIGEGDVAYDSKVGAEDGTTEDFSAFDRRLADRQTRGW